MADEKSAGANATRITFNWERVKKQAERKMHELKCNSPKIKKREELEAIRNQTTRLVKCFEEPGTTDTIMTPDITYDADGTSKLYNPPGADTYMNTEQQQQDRDMDMDRYRMMVDMNRDGTTPPTLLAPAPPQGERSNTGREVITSGDYGPDQNAIALLKKIKNSEVKGSDLQQDERRLVVRSLRLAGQTQDSISELLGVSRRTIVSDCKHLRQMAAMEIQNTDTVEIAGEVYDMAKTAIRKALAAGKYRTVSTIMRDMVELLQSMGLVYRAPKTQMNANLNANLAASRPGYQKYIDTIGEDKNKVVEVLDCMFSAINDNTL